MRGSRSDGCSSPTRAVKIGGNNPSGTNVIAFVNIATLGDALDFGDCTGNSSSNGSNSNGHGGL